MRVRSVSIGILLLGVLLAIVPAGAAQDRAKPEPRVVAGKAFLYERAPGEGLRAAVLLAVRYPLANRRVPERITAALQVEGPDGAAIATSRNRGSIPLAVRRQHLDFVHLLTYSRRESQAIAAAVGVAARQSRQGGGAGQALRMQAALGVRSGGETVRSHDAIMRQFELGTPPPRVVDGCVLKPETHCLGMELSGRFQGADLQRAKFMHAAFETAIFRDANLRGADFSSAQSEHVNVLDDAGLHLITFDRADMTSASLYHASFPRATFARTILAGANLTRATLTSAVFDNARLTDADLSGADISHARFRNADLTGANLSGANAGSADWSGATFSNTTCPDGTIATGQPCS